jgi:anti-sigma B factor antagonist
MATHTDIPVVRARGEIDLATARDLATQLSGLAGTGGDAALDLSAVSFIDSVGLGVVLKAAGRFHRQGHRLTLVAPPGPVRRLLDLSGATGRLNVVDELT